MARSPFTMPSATGISVRQDLLATRLGEAEAAWLAGRLTEAEAAFEAIAAGCKADGQAMIATRAQSELGQVKQERGHLRAAALTYLNGLAMATAPDSPTVQAAGPFHLGLAEVLRQQGELGAALDHATDGVELCRALARTRPLATGLATLAWIHLARGDASAARAAIAEAFSNAPSGEVIPHFNPAPAERARLLLALGDVEQAADWATKRGLSEDDTPTHPGEREYLVLARLLLARGAPDRALRLLDRIQAAAKAQGRLGGVIEARALQALALEAEGEPERALDALGEAVFLARPEGYVRVFADEGAPMAVLLRRLVESWRRAHIPLLGGALLDYVMRLLGPVRTGHSAHGLTRRRTTNRIPGLVEPLTERECDVLLLLAAGKANREIADDLVVTVDTVKKHLSHIFGKLGAASRTHALVRARELNLLQ